MQILRKLTNINIQQSVKCQLMLLNNKNITYLSNNKRNYCDVPKPKFPTLMEFPNVVWPSVVKSLKNWTLANFIITPRIDKDFHIKTFMEGSRKAVQMITQAMSTGDMQTLKELVSGEAYEELHKSLSNLSLSQKEQLALLSEDDIYFHFPYEIGLMFNDDKKRSIEITMVYHVFRGLKEYKNSTGNDEGGIQISSNPPYKDKLYVLNYRFLREYVTGGGDSGWIVNIVNHFKMEDLIPTPPSK